MNLESWNLSAPAANLNGQIKIERAYYADTIANFVARHPDNILGSLLKNSGFAIETTQSKAWAAQVQILQHALRGLTRPGKVYFEYGVPRLGKRIDVVAVVGPVVFVLEFKVGERDFAAHAIDQVYDYALDLKNFHESSHDKWIAPILIATEARTSQAYVSATPHSDRLLLPIRSSVESLTDVLLQVLEFADGADIDVAAWEAGRYLPTPTIIEAALALYGGHSVSEISRSDAAAINLSQTSEAITRIIHDAREKSQKVICFVTGVPGAGKTLVGLNIATQHFDQQSELYSVFLSGNGPLVAILREALARDKVQREVALGNRFTKGQARSEVKGFIQNVHHFRDECLVDADRPPPEHVALFDEAQRAWNLEQTAKFMQQKKGRPNFSQSEPEFLISCLDRHQDWAVIVCLVGGGQEINTGEAGISEWIRSLRRSFPRWQLYISPHLTDSEYGVEQLLNQLKMLPVTYLPELHLGVSMRSFRAESVSLLVKQLLDLEEQQAAQTLKQVNSRYPLVLTPQPC